MINWIMKRYGKVKPVVLDGFLYVVMAMGGALEAILTSKEVYDYMLPWIVFYMKMGLATFIAGAGALKMYRSKQYSEHRDEEDAKEVLNLTDGKQTITQQQTTEIKTNEKVIDPTA